MGSSEKSSDFFSAAEGVDESVPAPADPFQALDDLMAVVEELCPIWPQRDTFRNETLNRL